MVVDRMRNKKWRESGDTSNGSMCSASGFILLLVSPKFGSKDWGDMLEEDKAFSFAPAGCDSWCAIISSGTLWQSSLLRDHLNFSFWF